MTLIHGFKKYKNVNTELRKLGLGGETGGKKTTGET